MLPDVDIEEIAAICQTKTPRRVVEMIAEHRRIAAEALAKVNAEGTVVRTLKGDVIQHPAIRVHAEAAKAEAALLKEWGRKGAAVYS